MSQLQLQSLGIHLKVANIATSRAFYESLGFKPVFGYGDEAFRATLPQDCPSAPETYRGVTYQLPDGGSFEIADGHIAVKPETFPITIHTAKISAMIKVSSLLPLITHPTIVITYPVRHYYWNTIEAVVRDPDGFVLVFITPFSDHEMDALSPHVTIETIKPGDTLLPA